MSGWQSHTKTQQILELIQRLFLKDFLGISSPCSNEFGIIHSMLNISASRFQLVLTPALNFLVESYYFQINLSIKTYALHIYLKS